MAGGPEIGIVGLRAFIKSLETAGVEVQDLKAAANRAGNIVVNEAKSQAPVVSGRLAASIRQSKQKSGVVIRVGSAGVPYAGVIHFGWPHRNIRKNPFLYNASDAKRDEVIEAYTEELNRLVDKLGLA